MWIVTNARIRTRSSSNLNAREYKRAPRVYVFPQNESILEQFIGRRSRPHTEWRGLLNDVLRSLDVQNVQEIRWSQYAGCSCPCSPGFILNRDAWTPEKYRPFDVVVDVAWFDVPNPLIALRDVGHVFVTTVSTRTLLERPLTGGEVEIVSADAIARNDASTIFALEADPNVPPIIIDYVALMGL
jgi:hypothetical protein